MSRTFVSELGWIENRVLRRADRGDVGAQVAIGWLRFRRNEVENARLRRIAQNVGLPTRAYEPTTWPATG